MFHLLMEESWITEMNIYVCIYVGVWLTEAAYIQGRSEEEDEEETSIYQAVLSPDCQDVRLKKG